MDPRHRRQLLTVNVGRPARSAHTDADGGRTGFDKRPVDGPVAVAAPGPKGLAGSGLAGDSVVDIRHHGGDDQAVYAYAREDLDVWQRELDRELANGAFGENLTTSGVEVTGARIGERWRIGRQVLLEVTSPRIPCRTFQGRMEWSGWIKRFTQAGVPGAYLRVLEPGEIRAGDSVGLVFRPDHDITVGLVFRAVTTRRELLPRLLDAGDALHPEARVRALAYMERQRNGS
ncbi:MOSC domain-containing protein [Streptomyces pinistramenti]|uniref:MOSC domain-containing protein n=1 Tax=Streptomyces pinistramenti TaxID=2884812 RepID=UPI001D06F06C|nr:MOSC domain-containing protein [Streptomyces pinistramenti]MCB5911614.1 MOSC domain-containing protein [Streptomyces pinistramenti]